MTVEDTNPVPVTVRVRDVVSTMRVLGLRPVISGAGLFTTKFMGVPVPLLNEPFITTTGRFPALASCATGIAAVNIVALTKVVASL